MTKPNEVVEGSAGTFGYTPGTWIAGLDVPAAANNDADDRLVWAGTVCIASAKCVWIGRDSESANARLIAAAPDLLKACQSVYRLQGNLYADECAIKEAIKKATGV